MNLILIYDVQGHIAGISAAVSTILCLIFIFHDCLVPMINFLTQNNHTYSELPFFINPGSINEESFMSFAQPSIMGSTY